MEAKFTEQESLQMITQVIHQAQNNFRKGAGNITIFWGYLVTFAALLSFTINLLKPDFQTAWVWLLVIPGWLVSYLMNKKIMSKIPIHSLILAVCMVFGYIIPGWKFNQKAEENV